MNAGKYMIRGLALLLLSGCAGEPEPATEGEEATQGEVEESLSAAGCEQQAATCATEAQSEAELRRCEARRSSCVGLSRLTNAATGLLKAPLKVTGSVVGQIRPIAVGAVQGTTQVAVGVVQGTTQVAVGAIKGTTQVAVGAIQGTTQVAVGAIQGTTQVAVGAIQGTTQVAVGAIGGAVAVVEGIVPGVAEIGEDLKPCQVKVEACLEGALTDLDIEGCEATLQACVESVLDVGDTAVGIVNEVLPPAIQVPEVKQTVDCTAATTACLLQLHSPIKCAKELATCLKP